MNTLHDLRATLEAHALDAHDSTAHARTAAVRARARTVRRRRAAGATVAGALMVALAGAAALLPLGDVAPPAPAERTLLGSTAPETMRSLGWTYRFSTAVVSEEGRVLDGLAPSDRPRLVTWATAGSDQDVVVRGLDAPWSSDARDFGDFVWVPPGFEGDVAIEADAPGVALAVYELDPDEVPAGVSAGGITFRSDVAGLDQVDAVVGAAGQTDVSVEFTVPERTISVAHTCRGLPDGAVVHISLDGSDHGVVFGACHEDFDPGGSAGTSFPEGIGVPAGEESVARIWATRSMRDTTPLDPAEHPDARLGVGLYALAEDPLLLAGNELPRTVESRGRVWRLRTAEAVTGQRGPDITADVSWADGPLLVTAAHRTGGPTRTRLRVDGRAVDDHTTNVGRGGFAYTTLVPAGSRTVGVEYVRGGEDARETGLAIYRLVD